MCEREASMAMFGEFVKEKRKELRLTLREFCRMVDEDPSNWIKIERKILRPPQGRDKLEKIAGALNIDTGTDNWKLLNDYANVDAGIIPEYVMQKKELLQQLPAFFRTVGSEKPSKEALIELLETLQREGEAAE